MTKLISRRDMIRGTTAAALTSTTIYSPPAYAFWGALFRVATRVVPYVVRNISRAFFSNGTRRVAAGPVLKGGAAIQAADMALTAYDLHSILKSYNYAQPVRDAVVQTYDEAVLEATLEYGLENIWKPNGRNDIDLVVENGTAEEIFSPLELIITDVDKGRPVASKDYGPQHISPYYKGAIELPTITRLPPSMKAGDRFVIDAQFTNAPEVTIKSTDIIIVDSV